MAYIYEGGEIPRPESIVDVNDCHTRGTGIQHAKKRREALERCAVAYRGRDGDHTIQEVLRIKRAVVPLQRRQHRPLDGIARFVGKVELSL